MELTLSYVLLQTEREEKRKRQAFLERVPECWRPFHESGEHIISVFAGRRTGKTENIALKAARARHDCMIYVQNNYAIQPMIDYLYRFQTEEDLIETSYKQARNGCHLIWYESGREIQITPFSMARTHFMDHRWTNKVILFDEFDHADFEKLMKIMEPQIGRARQIAAAGSIRRLGDSYAKRWFKQSGYQEFIDARNFDYYYSSPEVRPAEVRPSIARPLIDHLPSSDDLFS